MSFKKIKNPEATELSLQYNGEIFTLGAKESKSFPSDVCEQWIFIYAFLGYDTEPVVEKKPEVKEVKVDKVTKK